MHLKYSIGSFSVPPNGFIVPIVCMLIFIGWMVLWYKLLFKGTTDSSKIAIIRTTNRKQIKVNSLTITRINRYLVWNNEWCVNIISIDRCSHVMNTGFCMVKPPLTLIPGFPKK